MRQRNTPDMCYPAQFGQRPHDRNLTGYVPAKYHQQHSPFHKSFRRTGLVQVSNQSLHMLTTKLSKLSCVFNAMAVDIPANLSDSILASARMRNT
jgi:hypothetical protein